MRLEIYFLKKKSKISPQTFIPKQAKGGCTFEVGRTQSKSGAKGCIWGAKKLTEENLKVVGGEVFNFKFGCFCYECNSVA
jgi:hypothetical protein